jgi:hypothetical protein
MTGRGRRTIALAVLTLLGGWSTGFAAERGAGTTYLYPGGPPSGSASYGSGGPASGSFRPADPAMGPRQGQTGTTAGSTWSPYAAGTGSDPAWGGAAYGFRGDAGSGQGGRPATDYRFRPRPEDKSTRADEGLRYRPDADLSRRSQQFWGVPGQDPALYGSGPAPVFRPLQPEREPTGRASTGGVQTFGEPAPPAWPAYPMGPSAGYGYPY